MYLLSDVLSAVDLMVKGVRNTRFKAGLCVLAAAFTSLLLAAPGATHAQSQASPAAPTAQIQIENQVDINTADADMLTLALDGVGFAKAQEIIAYREQNGDFKTVDDLQKVRGIGKATLERNRGRILLAPAEE